MGVTCKRVEEGVGHQWRKQSGKEKEERRGSQLRVRRKPGPPNKMKSNAKKKATKRRPMLRYIEIAKSWGHVPLAGIEKRKRNKKKRKE